MEINGKTKVYGLFGYPVEHSISPVIHNMLAEKLNQNLVYENFCVKPDGLEVAIKGAYELQIQGMNVTVPHKTMVMNHLVSIDEDAKQIGAVNTIIYKADGYHGTNTDCEGLHLALESDGISIENHDVIILGAGGAARAAIFMCMKYSKRPIYLVNRTFQRAYDLASEVNTYFNRTQVIPLVIDDIAKIPSVKNKYLSIQTTSVGLYPNSKECLIQDLDFYKKIAIGYDIIYTPKETQYMKYVKNAGGETYNGLKMLLFQAILSFETWRNVKVPLALSEEVFIKMKEVINERE